MTHHPVRLVPLFLLLAALALSAGCVKKPGQAEAEAFFIDWLQNHGEKNVVRTPNGVGVKGNSTRLRAWIYNTQGDGGKDIPWRRSSGSCCPTNGKSSNLSPG